MELSTRSFIPEHQNTLHSAQMKLRLSGEDFHDFTLSNPTAVALDYRCYQAAEHSGPLDLLGQRRSEVENGKQSPHYSAAALGLLAARQSISQHWHEPAYRPAPEHLVVLPSSSEAYHRLFTLLCDPGDEVLAPEPSYPLFAQLAQFANVKLVPYRLQYDGAWHIDFESLDNARTDLTRAILTVSPNNPTGCYTGKQQLRRLAERKLPLISDEVFARYRLDANDAIPRSAHGSSKALTFCIDGLSKSAGLPHVKLSWMSVSGPPALRDECLRRLSWLGDTYLSTASPIQQALPEILQQSQQFRTLLLQRLQQNLKVLRDLLRDSAASVLRAEGGWYAIVRLPDVMDDQQWAQTLLANAKILLHPGYYYDLDGPPHCVLSLLGPPEAFALATAALRRAIAECLSADSN